MARRAVCRARPAPSPPPPRSSREPSAPCKLLGLEGKSGGIRRAAGSRRRPSSQRGVGQLTFRRGAGRLRPPSSPHQPPSSKASAPSLAGLPSFLPSDGAVGKRGGWQRWQISILNAVLCVRADGWPRDPLIPHLPLGSGLRKPPLERGLAPLKQGKVPCPRVYAPPHFPFACEFSELPQTLNFPLLW